VCVLKFNIKDLDKIIADRDSHITEINATLYALYLFSQDGKDLDLTETEYKRLVEQIRYYANKNNISWLAIYSTTDSKTAKVQYERTGKRGRPKKIIAGDNVAGHAHICLVGNETQSAYSTATSIKKAVDKKYKKPICRVVSKGQGFNASNFINYCYKQADTIRNGGNFDFDRYVKKD
jgi:hypothetical protein